MGFLKWIFNLVLIAALAASSYFVIVKFVIGDSDNPTVAQHKFVDAITDEEHFTSTKGALNDKIFTVLLLGVDADDFDSGGRSDSIMIAVVDPLNNKISLTSVYRDLYVEIGDTGNMNKINAAFSFGGPSLAAKTIENTFDIEIDNYIAVNFNGFKDIVDAIGGLDIEVEKDMTHADFIKLNKGFQMLDGQKTLEYVRYRGDAEGDFGRARRQREVITEIADQTLQFRNVTNIIDIYSSVNNNLDTNISKIDLANLGLKMKDIKSDDIVINTFDAVPTRRNGISYIESNEDEMAKIQSVLNDQLLGEW